MKLHYVVLFAFLSFSLYAIDSPELKKIQQRIQPIGQVHIQKSNESSNQGEAGNKIATAGKKKPGQEIYEHHCIVCHRDGLVGAPKLEDEKDWKPHLNEKTLEDLVASSIKGLNAMPAKGTCSECSEADLKDAIQYMLPKS
jgi:cytochrome c5